VRRLQPADHALAGGLKALVFRLPNMFCSRPDRVNSVIMTFVSYQFYACRGPPACKSLQAGI
jgi:hypothetical protein